MMQRKKIASDAIIVFISLALNVLFAYTLRVILARELGPTDYGLFAAALSFVSLLLLFRSLGLNKALVQKIAKSKADNPSVTNSALVATIITQLAISTLISAVLIYSADYLAANYFNDSRAHELLQVFAVYIIVSAVTIFLRSALQGFQHISSAAISESVRLLTALVASVLFLEYGLGLVSPVLGHVVGWIVSALFLTIQSRKYIYNLRHGITQFTRVAKSLYVFGAVILIGNLGHRIIAHLDMTILTAYISLSDIGQYSVAVSISALILFFSTGMCAVTYPRMSQTDRKVSHLLNESLFISTLLATPLLVIILIFPSQILGYFFGFEFTGAAQILQLLSIGVFIHGITQLNTSTLTSQNNPKHATLTILTIALANLLLNILLIPVMGSVGAALASLTSYLTGMIASIGFIYRMQLRIHFKRMIKCVICGLIQGLFTLWIHSILGTDPLGLIITAIASVTMYFAGTHIARLWTFKTIKNTIFP